MHSLIKLTELLETNNIFLTGGAGVGKSYLTKEVISWYQKEYQGVIVLGSTGISAVNVGGQTIHSFFVFGIAGNLEELSSGDRYNKSRIKELCKLLKSTDLIIIDEISMVSADLMEMILYRFRQCGYTGKLMVVGDFYQLPPVQKAGRKPSQNIFEQDQGIYAFESSAWEIFDFMTVALTKIKRTSNTDFMKILEKIRIGEADEEVFHYLEHLRHNSFEGENEATVLFGTNAQADRLNLQKVAAVKRQEIDLPAIVKVKDPSIDNRRIEGWKKNLPVIENLKLKEGIPVIFTTNKWGSYHNGERAVVEHIDKDAIVVEKKGKLVKVDRFSFELSRPALSADGMIENDTVAVLEQFPLRPAYAITIHKSQGMSIEKLICNVDTIFADSQFYVALSRAVDPAFLKISYGRNDFQNYLQRAVRVSERVRKFYDKAEMMLLE
jgi:ATP-dependent exoDNAse (exonuclease V) alpha subunit